MLISIVLFFNFNNKFHLLLLRQFLLLSKLFHFFNSISSRIWAKNRFSYFFIHFLCILSTCFSICIRFRRSPIVLGSRYWTAFSSVSNACNSFCNAFFCPATASFVLSNSSYCACVSFSSYLSNNCCTDTISSNGCGLPLIFNQWAFLSFLYSSVLAFATSFDNLFLII